MPLESLLKLLFAAKLPLAAAAFGLTLNLSGDNAIARNVGASAVYLGLGSAVTIVSRKNTQLAEMRQLEARHARESAALKSSVETAIKDSAIAQQTVQQRENALSQLRSELAQLGIAITEVKTERDRLKTEILKMSDGMNRMSASLSVCDSDKSQLAGKLHDLELERTQLIAELYETAVEEVAIAENIAALEKQFENDKAYQITQKKKVKSEWTKARANMHTELAEANERINELEQALKEKTELAQSMIADLSGDANSKFTQFSGQAGAQNELINGLRAQIDELRKSNTALTFRRFDTVGTDNIIGNRLIDLLAKHGSAYGAHHHEREGHNGRLKIWLKMIDAPLKRALDALDDIQAEMKPNLWDKPTVKVDRGMHLFTLATEQEHKVLAAPDVPLSRLEKTLDKAIHVRIVGGSGSGKTVLLNNLMHYMAASMKGANVTLLDPKAVDDWGSFTPRYWGEECVTGIVDLADSLKWRVADTVRARKAGRPAPKYDPELFVLDEAQHNYLLAQNADDSYVKERGEQAPNFAKKAKGALAGLLSLGRAYNAIGLFVTQLPQVSKVGLNEGSFDPCVNIFLGAQIDNAIDSFLPSCGFTDVRCKALSNELATRRKLGQKWVMLVSDLPKTKAYLMECPAPGFYHNRFSKDFGIAAQSAGAAENLQSTSQEELQPFSESEGCKAPAEDLQASAGISAGVSKPSAHCPDCSHLSSKYHGTKPQKNGKYRFVCENDACEKGAKKGTFSAFPLA